MSRITITAAHALASVTHVPLGHLAEAVQYRALDRAYFSQ